MPKQDLYDSGGNFVGSMEIGNAEDALGALLGIAFLFIIGAVITVPFSIFYFGYRGLVALWQDRFCDAIKNFLISGTAFVVTIVVIFTVIFGPGLGRQYQINKFESKITGGVTSQVAYQQNGILVAPIDITNTSDQELHFRVYIQYFVHEVGREDTSFMVWRYSESTLLPIDVTIKQNLPLPNIGIKDVALFWADLSIAENDTETTITSCYIDIAYTETGNGTQIPCYR